MTVNLLTITTKYRRFTKNQVLTAGHLNEILNFFDDQDRLTRICLSGVGIVCGFRLGYDENTHILTISQGTGITTDGDLFHLYEEGEANGGKTIDLENKQYRHYKAYDNKKAGYKPFFYDGNDQLEIFELLTDEQQAIDNDDTFVLEDLQANEGLDIDNAVALLYLECYEKEKDLCSSLSCDNQGLEIIGNYKVLLVSKEVAAQINAHDTIISKVNYAGLYHQLPDIKASRIALQPEDFIHYNELKRSFTERALQHNIVAKLRQGFQLLLTAMNMPVLLGAIDDRLAAVFNYTGNTAPPDFQYRYDLLKDIIDTYNEIRSLLFHLDHGYCCPDIKSFPKHLMLGEIVKTGTCYTYRHAFYSSPLLRTQNLSTCTDCLPSAPLASPGPENTIEEVVIDEEGNELTVCYGKNTDEERLFSLIKRVVQLLANYNANYNIIKITPSRHHGPLSAKAIPFYVNVGEHLLELWDFDKTVLGRQRDNISYHNSLLNIKQPLEISTDHDFYRIEGHQGKNYKEALQKIEELRREHGLGFNVIALSIDAPESEDLVENFTSYYLNKNHGYEHKAGVTPGGTFVMIYIEGEYDSYPYPYGHGFPHGFPNEDSLAGDFEGEEDEEELVILNPVVADFCLPYLCCDENRISLSLPADTLCFDEDTRPLPFHVTPTGGFVSAEVEEGLHGGVTTDEFGAFVFDPHLVSDELYGSPITFTVNNFETDCSITVSQRPEFGFEVSNIDPVENNRIVVDFDITGNNLVDGMEYTWDFGDNSQPVITTAIDIQHTYSLDDLGEGRSVVVTLSGGQDDCLHRVQDTVTFETSGTACIDTARLFVREARELLDQLPEDNLNPRITTAAATVRGHLDHFGEQLDAFTNGSLNAQLPEMFSEEAFQQLFGAANITEAAEDRGAVQMITEVYVPLFYTILRCQGPERLMAGANEDIIMGVSRNISTFFEQLREINLNVDTDNTLKAFLRSMLEIFRGISFLTEQVSEQIRILTFNG